jgi:hypothetical protein
MKEKRGQMEMSFGMIFSIFLIIIFLAAAFFAIQKFLDLQNNLKNKQFIDEFQKDLDRIWRSSQSSQEVEYSVSSKVGSVCLISEGLASEKKENLIIKEKDQIIVLERKKLEHLDLEKSLGTSDRLCFEIKNSKVSMILKKNYGELSVTVQRN